MISAPIIASIVALLTLAITSTSELSDLCKAQVEILSNSAALMDASKDQILPDCNIDLSIEDSCTADFSTISSEFERVCVEEGGQFIEQDMTLDCSVKAFGNKYNADFYYLNYPACYGSNCTVDEIVEDFETNLFASLDKRQMASAGFTCDFSAGRKVRGFALALFSALFLTMGIF